MKRVVLLIALLIVSGLCYAQLSVTTLDRGINDTVVYFENRLQNGAKVIILNMNTSQTDLSDYIINELAAYKEPVSFYLPSVVRIGGVRLNSATGTTNIGSNM